jgi:predicted transcriptional regulator
MLQIDASSPIVFAFLKQGRRYTSKIHLKKNISQNRLNQKGDNMKELTAKHVMNPNVLVAESDWSVSRLADFFMENCISGAPVQSSTGKPIGVVSLTDIVHHETQPEKDRDWPHDYYLHALERQYAREEAACFQIETESLTTVRDIMTPDIFQVSENTPVQQVAHMMIKNRIHRVIVLRDKKVVGIISTPDILKIVRDM